MRVNIERDYKFFLAETDKLRSLLSEINVLPPKFQTFLAEIMMLRLFGLLETTLKSIAVKLLCNAPYLDGTTPRVIVASRSMRMAESLMKSHGRSRSIELRWTRVRDIKENVKHLLDPNDDFFNNIDIFINDYNEMRRVRNHIAHRNDSTRKRFRDVVRGYYGGYVNRVTPGILILSRRYSRPPLIEQYLGRSRTLVRQIVKR